MSRFVFCQDFCRARMYATVPEPLQALALAHTRRCITRVTVHYLRFSCHYIIHKKKYELLWHIAYDPNPPAEYLSYCYAAYTTLRDEYATRAPLRPGPNRLLSSPTKRQNVKNMMSTGPQASQRAWRRCISVPEYVVCKKRLCSEFETKYLECCISNFLIRNFLAVAGSLGTA